MDVDYLKDQTLCFPGFMLKFAALMDKVRENYAAFLADVMDAIRQKNAQRAGELLADTRADDLAQIYKAKLRHLVSLAQPVFKVPSGYLV